MVKTNMHQGRGNVLWHVSWAVYTSMIGAQSDVDSIRQRLHTSRTRGGTVSQDVQPAGCQD